MFIRRMQFLGWQVLHFGFFLLGLLLSTVLSLDPIWAGFNHLAESMRELGIFYLFLMFLLNLVLCYEVFVLVRDLG